MSVAVRLYVGAGGDAPEWAAKGWLCNDLEAAAALYAPHIQLIGPCWKLDVADNSVDELMAKGMLEHLTYHEVDNALAEWKRVLRPDGFVTIEVPDLLEYFRQYALMTQHPELHAGEGVGGTDSEPQDFEVCNGPGRWLRRALYGWQRYPGDEHRSGWTEDLLRFYLRKLSSRYEIRHMAYGFDEDDPNAKMRHLWARGWKE